MCLERWRSAPVTQQVHGRAEAGHIRHFPLRLPGPDFALHVPFPSLNDSRNPIACRAVSILHTGPALATASLGMSGPQGCALLSFWLSSRSAAQGSLVTRAVSAVGLGGHAPVCLPRVCVWPPCRWGWKHHRARCSCPSIRKKRYL